MRGKVSVGKMISSLVAHLASTPYMLCEINGENGF